MKRIVAVLAFCVLMVAAYAQVTESASIAYQRDFVKADLAGKAKLVERVSSAENEGLAPFFIAALEFSLRNADLLKDEPIFSLMTASAASAVGDAEYTETLSLLRRVFMAFRDSSVRVAALRSMSLLGKGDSQVVETLNQFLANQNNLQRSGLSPDLQTLGACIDALAVLGDSTSYASLFASMLAEYPPEIRLRSAEALRLIRGDYKRFLIDVVKKNPPFEKATAFRTGMENAAFTASERGELAEAALDISLSLYPTDPEDLAAISELRYSAVRELTSLRWTRATTLAVKNFYRVQTDYSKDPLLKERFIEAIACLGAMSSSEAAQALSLQLGLVNADMERSRSYDQDILIAVIDALGDLGDKVAFDYLLYIGYLSYPDHVKAAAREALNRLKW